MTTAAAVLQHPTTFDEIKAKAFAGQMLGALNGAALSLMASIGHRTGLFDNLAAIAPCTAQELATESDLAERYVREWLAVMTTSRVVEYDPASATYLLPKEHAAFLTRKGSIKNIAATAQFSSVVGGVEDEIIARFRDGKGLCYHHYGRFHEVMAEASYQSVVAPFVEHVLPLAPGLRERLEQGIDVVDVGCGGGRALLLLAGTFPNSRFTGVDLCADAFAPAVEEARAKGLRNLMFEERDVSGMETLGAYDLVLACDAVHDQKSPQAMLRMIRQSLRQDGVFLMVEFGGSSRLENNLVHPIAPFLYMMSVMHCMPVSLSQGGEALGTMWGVELATEMLGRAGFGDVEVSRLPHDAFNAYFVARP
ncbi:MAG: transcriptional regulator [Hoeflea sp. BRH_c9]|nr:MAG: transcriptional regulator [Hoeflea sp. BRH_c9]